MDHIKTIAEWMTVRGVQQAELVAKAALEPRVVDAIIQGRYTPSPQQRQALAAALGVSPAEVVWGHKVEVEHMYGHGPQFGRSP